MGRAPHVLLLLLVGTACGSVAGFVGDDEALRLRTDSELTRHLFDLPTVKRTLQEHPRRLKSRQTSVTEIQSRLDAIEAGQKLTNQQLASALQRLEAISECRGSGVQLSAALTELRTAVSQSAELTGRIEAALSDGLLAPETEPPTTTAEPTEPPTTTPEPTEPPTRRPAPTKEPQCALPLRPNEDGDITEYSGQRYGNKPDSRWEYSELPGKIDIKSEITVEFKTIAREGIIFYAAAENQIDFIALYLKNGSVVYAFDCGSGAVIISSDMNYNDDTWHTATFKRDRLRGELHIDGELVAFGDSVGASQNIQVDPPYFLGGLSEEIKENTRLQGNVEKIDTSFNGCLRNLRMYNTPFGNPSRREHVTTCSNKVEQGAFFSVEGGYMVAARRFRVGPQAQIELHVRPRKLGGVLLAVHGRKDFLILQMIEGGSLLLTVENGRGPVTAIFTPDEKHQLCDGQWHKIKVVKVRNVAVVAVDDITSRPVFGVAGVSSADTNSPLYVGGVPSWNIGGIVTQESYVGCIRNLTIKGSNQISLADAQVFGAVTANTCPLM